MVNTILPALEILCREGMSKDSPLKIQKALKEIRRDSKRYHWTDDTIETLPEEWQWRICSARLQLGILDYRGWMFRESRMGFDPFDIPKWNSGLPIYPVKPEVSEPEHVNNLLIYSEQGIGEQLRFSQALKYVRPYAKHITVEIEPRLAPAFQRSFPDFRIHPLSDLRDASWVEEGEFDAKAILGDVLARFIRSKDKIAREAYIVPDKVEYWRQWLEDNVPKPWTGFSWAGRQGFLNPEIAQSGWVNLQYGEWEVPDHLITPPINLKEDIEDLFGIVANLEKVVSIPTTIIHIAASIGTDVEIIMTPGKGQVNNAVMWEMGMPGERVMPWYPYCTKIFRNVEQWLRAQ